MSTLPQADPTVEAALAWSRFLASLRRARARAAQDPEAELTLPQYLLIAPLADEPGRTVGALAAAAGVASPSATRMLDGLERDGIVRREASAHDRRAVTVRLTRAGARVVRVERARLEAKRAMLFDALDSEERAQGARLLDRLADVLEDM